MTYQVIMNIGGEKPSQIASGIWEDSAKAFAELSGMAYGRIPVHTAWNVSLIIRR